MPVSFLFFKLLQVKRLVLEQTAILLPYVLRRYFLSPALSIKNSRTESGMKRNVGAFGGGDPPLPFPNRVVKPVSADGTGSDVPGE